VNYAAMRYLTAGGCPVEGAAWQVCAVIAWHADKTTGDSYISRRNIAKQARLSTGTVHAVLVDLVDRGILEIVVTGTGRRAMTYRLAAQPPSRKQDPVVAQSTDRSGSVDPTVVAQLVSPSIGRREEQEGFEGRASAAPPDGGAPRSDTPNPKSNSSVPAEASAAIAALKASLRPAPPTPSAPPSSAPPVTAPTVTECEPNPSVECEPADVLATAPAKVEPPHPAVAREPHDEHNERDAHDEHEPARRKQRRGRRGREPPATCRSGPRCVRVRHASGAHSAAAQ
jgi:hypothetical protein